ncbi:hypothetical protein D3C75_931430 [compost metagenome]
MENGMFQMVLNRIALRLGLKAIIAGAVIIDLHQQITHSVLPFTISILQQLFNIKKKSPGGSSFYSIQGDSRGYCTAGLKCPCSTITLILLCPY